MTFMIFRCLRLRSSKSCWTQCWKSCLISLTSYNTDDMVALQDSPCRSLYLLCEGGVRVWPIPTERRSPSRRWKLPGTSCSCIYLWISETDSWYLCKQPRNAVYGSSLKMISWIWWRKDEVVLRNFLRRYPIKASFSVVNWMEFALQNLTTRLLKYIQKRVPFRTCRR